jgi:hypothetical protein
MTLRPVSTYGGCNRFRVGAQHCLPFSPKGLRPISARLTEFFAVLTIFLFTLPCSAGFYDSPMRAWIPS